MVYLLSIQLPAAPPPILPSLPQAHEYEKPQAEVISQVWEQMAFAERSYKLDSPYVVAVSNDKLKLLMAQTNHFHLTDELMHVQRVCALNIWF